MFSKVPQRNPSVRVNQWVYSSLCQLILDGEFVPGVSITLRGIADSLEVSPMPVREAVTRLISEGALDVSEHSRISVSVMNQSKFDEILYARLQLEPKIASQSLKLIDRKKIKQLDEIDKQLDLCLETGNIDGYIKYNRLFHFGIYQSANSPVIFPMINSLWLQFSPFMRVVAGIVGTNTIHDYHKAALNAIIGQNHKALYDAIHNDISEGMGLLNDSIVN